MRVSTCPKDQQLLTAKRDDQNEAVSCLTAFGKGIEDIEHLDSGVQLPKTGGKRKYCFLFLASQQTLTAWRPSGWLRRSDQSAAHERTTLVLVVTRPFYQPA
jgi:hypothetical protein